jgi:molybdate transport system substrate-binding protein
MNQEVKKLVDTRLLGAFLAALLFATNACICQEQQNELTVFTASSLTGAFGEITQLYENETNINVMSNYDGSQVLRTQIDNGAYADVFASANTKQMNALKAEGLMNNSSVSIFTRNKLALIIPRDNPAGIHNLTDLARPGVKIVIGTKDVPVGDYAMQIINKLGNDSAYGPDYKIKVTNNIISRETNVNYVVTKVALGEADVGFAYVSDVTKDLAAKVDKVEIPDKYNVIAEYPIGILKQSKYPIGAKRFIDLVKSDKGAAILEKYGFSPIGGVALTINATGSRTPAEASA